MFCCYIVVYVINIARLGHASSMHAHDPRELKKKPPYVNIAKKNTQLFVFSNNVLGGKYIAV